MRLKTVRVAAGLITTSALLTACASSAPPPLYPAPSAPTAAVSAGTVDGKPAPTPGSRFNPASGTTNQGAK